MVRSCHFDALKQSLDEDTGHCMPSLQSRDCDASLSLHQRFCYRFVTAYFTRSAMHYSNVYEVWVIRLIENAIFAYSSPRFAYKSAANRHKTFRLFLTNAFPMFAGTFAFDFTDCHIKVANFHNYLTAPSRCWCKRNDNATHRPMDHS